MQQRSRYRGSGNGGAGNNGGFTRAGIRHIFVCNVGSIEAVPLFATVALLAVLIAGIGLIKPGQIT